MEFRGNGACIILSKTLGERVTLLPQKEVIVGIRPEHLSLSKPNQEENVLQGEVYVVEPQSNEYIIDLRVGEEVVKARVEKRELPALPRTGEVLRVFFEDRYCYVFDPESEKRLL